MKSDDCLYLQVAHTLKNEIVGGVYPVGSRLPTEQELCQRFSVSRYTIREALRRLRDDNLVASRKGAGTTVILPRVPDPDGQHLMSINDLVTFASSARLVVKSIRMVLINEKLASRTGLQSGSEWLEVHGFGYTDGVEVPTCWAEYYINRKFAAVGRLLQRHTGPVFPLIEDMFGQRIVEVDQEIGATLISPALAGDLKEPAGTAALEVRRIYKLTNDEIAQVTISTHPASRLRHSMTLRRVKG
jgi:GntR family transcriptional regulator